MPLTVMLSPAANAAGLAVIFGVVVTEALAVEADVLPVTVMVWLPAVLSGMATMEIKPPAEVVVLSPLWMISVLSSKVKVNASEAPKNVPVIWMEVPTDPVAWSSVILAELSSVKEMEAITVTFPE